jgi:hypothetical protein
MRPNNVKNLNESINSINESIRANPSNVNFLIKKREELLGIKAALTSNDTPTYKATGAIPCGGPTLPLKPEFGGTGTSYGAVGGNLNMLNNRIINLGAPVLPADGANKSYVDNFVKGLIVKTPCLVASATDLGAAGTGATGVSYNSAAGSMFALVASGGITIDSISLTSPNSFARILLKDQTVPASNGIWEYDYTGPTVLNLLRASDFNSNVNTAIGDITYVTTGLSNGNTQWVLTGVSPISVGTGSLLFSEFSSSRVYNSGTGISINQIANTVNANLNPFGAVTVNGSNQLGVNVAALTGLSINGSNQLTLGRTGGLDVTSGNLLTTKLSATGGITVNGSNALGVQTRGGLVVDSGNFLSTNLIAAGGITVNGSNQLVIPTSGGLAVTGGNLTINQAVNSGITINAANQLGLNLAPMPASGLVINGGNQLSLANTSTIVQVPALNSASGTFTMNPNASSYVSYIQFGTAFYVNYHLSWTAKPATGSDVVLIPLPSAVTAIGGPNSRYSFSVGYAAGVALTSIAGASWITAEVVGGTTDVILWANNPTGVAPTQLTVATFNTSGEIHLGGWVLSA